MDKDVTTIAAIAGRLNAEKIAWCAGGSFMLDSYGIAPGYRDIDIIVAETHRVRADRILAGMGTRLPSGASDVFASEFYCGYLIGGMKADLIAGFTIRVHGSAYRYHFDGESVTGSIALQGISIPLAAPEDWFVLYQMIPGKEDKADAIGRYLKKNGIAHPGLLRRARTQALPRYITDAINKITAAP
jgi:hypothetical protein